MSVTSSGSAIVTLPTDEQILITREFDAPKHLVYKAWTTPELVKRWWAGRRGTVTVAEIDLRVGGAWRYVLIAEGGFEVGFHGEYREIVPNERIVNDRDLRGDARRRSGGHHHDVQRGRRAHDARAAHEVTSKEVRDMIIESGMEGGVQEGFDIIEEIVRELT